MTPTDRIKQEAEDYANSHINGRSQRDVWEIVFKAHEAGATATHDRAKVLADALEAFILWQGPTLKNWPVMEQAREALEQWEGEEVDNPCPHCGKELNRDRNLCCRECGKEVGDES